MGISIKTKTKSCVPHGTKTSFYFEFIYIKTHLWARTRNGPKARFQCKSVDLSLSLRMNRPGTNLVLLPINFGFAYLNKTTGLFRIQMLTIKFAFNS